MVSRFAATGEHPRADILHVDLVEPVAPILAAHSLYWIIFWYGDIPVGQRELASTVGDAIDLQALADATVDPNALQAAVDFRRRPRSPSLDQRISVVICTRDRPADLARCLASLPHQTRPPDEVIVVDNASVGPETRLAAERAQVIYVREDRPGLDVARNTGALTASGDFIFYTDDDVVLHPRWLENMVSAFEPSIDAVTGIVLPGELESEAQLHFERFWGFGKGYVPKDFGAEFFAADHSTGCAAWEIGAGASMGFRASVFREVGLFDERLDVGAAGCSGDSEYWHRLLSHGRRCRYDSAVVAFHFHRKDVEGLRRQLRAYMRGHSAALLVQYERTGNRGNLRRALWTMPGWFLRRAFAPHKDDDRRFLIAEVSGFLGGFSFYLRAPRPR